MSSLHAGDDDLHYSDSSHRWIAPPDVSDKAWREKVGAHMAEHREHPNAGTGPAGRRTAESEPRRRRVAR